MTSEQPTYVETPESTIYYEKIGVDPGGPLVLLYGGPGFNHTYLKISPAWERLSADRAVIFYDQRGTGGSSEVKPEDPCGLAELMSDLEALRDHLGVDQMDLLGHSWGGYLAMAYTARYPAKVRRMILAESTAPKLVDTADLFENIFPRTVERQNAVDFAVELGDEKAVQEAITAYMSMLCYSPEKRDEFLAKVDPRGYRRHVNLKISGDAQRDDLSPEIRKFSQSTLVISGRYDINVAPSLAYGIHKAIPNSQFEVFERSGHLPFFEEPEAFARAVEKFLSVG